MTRRREGRSSESIEFAREQRQGANEFAATVWQWIRNRQIDDAKFRREYPIPPYTVDFCCVERMLVVEVDGKGHWTEEGIEQDLVRDRFLKSLGYRVLRIPGYAVLRDGSGVIDMIRELVKRT